MILATYQPKNWKQKRFSYTVDLALKYALRLQQEQPFYWCFAANTLSQALLYSFLTEPFQPEKLILLETDDYIPIDRIKYSQFREDEPNMDFDEIINPQNPALTDYVITAIPEHYASVSLDLSDIEQLPDYKTLLQKNQIKESDITDLCKKWQSVRQAYITLEQKNYSARPDTIHIMPLKLIELAAAKMAFEANVFGIAYRLCYTALTGKVISKTQRAATITWQQRMLLQSAYVKNMMNPFLSYAELNECMLEQCRKVYAVMFPDTYANTKTNDTCPCGSGKKYKRCCKNSINILQFLTEKQ